MQYTNSTALHEFRSFLLMTYPSIVENPDYPAMEENWTVVLKNIQPYITARTCPRWPRLSEDDRSEKVRALTGVGDPQATLRTLHFGLLSYLVCVEVKDRAAIISQVDIIEAARDWAHTTNRTGDAFNAAKSVGPIWDKALPRVNVLGSKYLDIHIKPNVTKNGSLNDALAWFAEHFLSGAVLGTRLDILILRKIKG